MLVLSRKQNQKIFIGEEITIIVVEIRGDKVRLGIEAPKEINIVREELVTQERNESDGEENKKEQPSIEGR